MNAPRKKPVGKPGKASANIPSAKVKKPVAGHVAKPDAAPAPPPEPFFYSEGEEFLWLEDAVKLEQGVGEDYASVRASVNKARSLVIHLMRQELAQNDLPRFKQPSKSDIATLRKWMALQTVKATGKVKDRLVRYEIMRAGQMADGEFIDDIATARNLKKKDRPEELNRERVKYLARFLVDHWCDVPPMNAPLHHHLPYPIGSYSLWFDLLKTDKLSDEFEWFDKDSKRWGGDAPLFDKTKPFYFLPPLCFLNENMRARFVADFLQRDHSDADMRPHAITNWVTKLGLKTASKPTITGINVTDIRDGKKRIKLVVVT